MHRFYLILEKINTPKLKRVNILGLFKEPIKLENSIALFTIKSMIITMN